MAPILLVATGGGISVFLVFCGMLQLFEGAMPPYKHKEVVMWRLVVVGTIVGVFLLGSIGLGQPEPEPATSFVVSDLQLISTASKPDWSNRWTGPVEAATILAWFHDHGFPEFLPDLNGDGVVDELDTIELADVFGRGVMRTTTPLGTTDARLVRGLAEYVADKYPGGFELKIYDRSFPMEFNREFPIDFAPDVIPGIVLTLKEAEPNFQAYKEELTSAEGVIIGIEQNERLNYYFAGRSFLFGKTAQGNDGIDLAWGEEDPWTAGIQGQVLETEGRQTDAWYILYQGEWVKVEFMLALSPLVERDQDTGEHGPCPDGAIGYDVSTTTTPFGDVRIEECVTRDGDIDTYTYTVTNISFEKNGCGICYFSVMNLGGFTTVDQSGPGAWLINPFHPAGWEWLAPLGSCGIEVGESAVFSFSVLGPTYDVMVKGLVSPCPHIGAVMTTDDDSEDDMIVNALDREWVVYSVRTTGPSSNPPDDHGGHCPDLTIHVIRSSCSCEWTQQKELKCTVEVYATVENIGDQPATHFYCELKSAVGGDQILVANLDPGASKSLHFQFSYTVPRGAGPACPLNFVVKADSKDFIDECNEKNNFDTGEVCCD